MKATERWTSTAFVLIIAALHGCAAPQAPVAKSQTPRANSCPISADVPNASYVGPYHGVENLLTPAQMAQDLNCADEFKSRKHPSGFVTIFGSSRIKEKNERGTPDVIAANDTIYQEVRSFAHKWTQKYGDKYPIMTGAGPGLMEAGSRGAKEAGGRSIGYTTYYDRTSSSTPTRPYGGDPRLAFVKHDGKEIITDGLIFSSIAMRETMMIMHSAAIVIAPGGAGTEWETFQILETLKSKQLTAVPVYIIGDREMHWRSFDDRLSDMTRRTTINEGEVTNGVEFVDNAEEVVERLRIRLNLGAT